MVVRMRGSGKPMTRPRYFYGWNIVFVGFLSTVVSGLGVYTLAIFVKPMTAASPRPSWGRCWTGAGPGS